MNSKGRLSEICIYSIALLIFTFLALNNILIYTVALLFVPALIAYICCITNKTESALMLFALLIFNFVTSFVCLSLAQTFIRLITLLLMLIPGVITGFSFKKQWCFSQTLFSTCAFEFAVLILILVYAKFGLNFNFYNSLSKDLIETYSKVIPGVKSLDPDFAVIISQHEKDVFYVFTKLIPSIIPFFISTIIISVNLVRYLLSKAMCKIYLLKENIFIDGFDTLRMNIVSNIFLAVCVLVIFACNSDNTAMIFINVVLTLLVVYFFAGISLIDYRLKEKALTTVRRFVLLLVFFIICLILSVFIPVINMFYIMVFLAFLDSLFDFRKLKTKKGDDI